MLQKDNKWPTNTANLAFIGLQRAPLTGSEHIVIASITMISASLHCSIFSKASLWPSLNIWMFEATVRGYISDTSHDLRKLMSYFTK